MEPHATVHGSKGVADDLTSCMTVLEFLLLQLYLRVINEGMVLAIMGELY